MTNPATERLRSTCITVFGTGHIPIASGTWGSAASCVPALIVWLLLALGGPRWIFEAFLVFGILKASVLSVRWGRWAIEKFGRKDPKQFVLDEFAGQYVALLLLPISLSADFWSVTCVFGVHFILFRIMDIIKPPPARQLERLPDGWGVLVDDLFAGAYANILGQLLWYFTPLATWLGVTLANGGGA